MNTKCSSASSSSSVSSSVSMNPANDGHSNAQIEADDLLAASMAPPFGQGQLQSSPRPLQANSALSSASSLVAAPPPLISISKHSAANEQMAQSCESPFIDESIVDSLPSINNSGSLSKHKHASRFNSDHQSELDIEKNRQFLSILNQNRLG